MDDLAENLPRLICRRMMRSVVVNKNVILYCNFMSCHSIKHISADPLSKGFRRTKLGPAGSDAGFIIYYQLIEMYGKIRAIKTNWD